MKKISLIITLLAVTCLAQAKTFLVANRLVDDVSVSAFCANFPGECKVLSADVKDFGDKSIFVQFKESVVGDDVVVAVPYDEKSDAFLEALLKIRTAKSLGAGKVSALVSQPISELGWRLAQVAGADTALEVSPMSNPSKIILTETALNFDLRNRPRLTSGDADTFVFSFEENSLVNKLAANMGAKVFNDREELARALRKQPQDAKTRVIVVSQWNVNDGNKKLITDIELVDDLKKSIVDFGIAKKEVVFVLPYLPYARGDKVDHENTVVSGRLAADLIEAAGPDLVMFSRLHAGQSQGFFSVPTLHVSGRPTVNSKLKDLGIDLVVSPDAGFQKEATRYADDLGLRVIVLNKKRNKDGSTELKTMGSMPLKGKKVVIIDDETASGGTLGLAAQYLKSKGAAAVYGVVTHLAGNADKAIKDPAIDHIFVTSTMVSKSSDPSRLTVLEIADEFSNALSRLLNTSTNCADILAGTK